MSQQDMNTNKLPAKRGRKQGATMEHTRVRRHEVMRILLKGTQRDNIVNDIMTRFKVSEPTVTLDLQKCYQELKEQFAGMSADMIARHTAMLYKLYCDWDGMDGHLQIKCIDTINKMAGLYKPENQVVVNTLNVNLENLSVEELKQLLNGKSE